MSKAAHPSFRIRGRVIDCKTGRGIEGLRVEAWDKDLICDDLVGSAVTDEKGAFQIEFDESYFSELFFDRRPDLFFKVYRDDCLVASTEDSVLWNVECGETEVTIEVDLSTVIEHPAERRSVEGHVFFDNGLPAASITLRFYNRGFGGADSRLGEVKTDDRGFYALSYDSGGKPVNLEARIVDAASKEVSLSATKYNAEKHEVLNLVAPSTAKPPAPEYDRLTADLVKQLGDLSKLADTREDSERQDLTLLHQATGWDARLIALAAIAFKLRTETGIEPDVLYALFRVGLPTNKQQLALVSAETAETALGKALQVGIISLRPPRDIAQAKEEFEGFARNNRGEVKAPGALSSFGDLLAKSGLTGDEKSIFEDLYFAHRDASAELWQKAQEKGISQEKINGLRLQGKLAYLTFNNADLTASLQQDIGSPESLAQLVDNDLHQSDAWKKRINDLADGNEQALQRLIPPAYVGATTADRLEAYTADLARKVRLSFPTQVIGRMIEKDELRLGDNHDALKTPVRTFLQKAVGLGFELGRVPVDAFVRDNREQLFRGDTPEQIEATTQSVKHLQRLYQVTPTDEALKTMLDQGFTSAHDIVEFSYEDFVASFGDKFPSREEARLVYRKAQQVSAVAHNVLIMARQMDSTPAVYAISPSPEVPKNVK